MCYECSSAVVLIVFNRPVEATAVFSRIRQVRPPRLYIVSDGPRRAVADDEAKVAACRDLASLVDWPCAVVPIISPENMGCKKRVITGLTEVFRAEESAIILEDDCVPTGAFFAFAEWALLRYRADQRVGIVSGSNLLAYLAAQSPVKAGFSRYMNCWGWATWRRTWERYDPLLSIRELQLRGRLVMSGIPISALERTFWLGVFMHTAYDDTNWDFYLQYAMFKHGLLSVYPSANLVENIGFGPNATHTRGNTPHYVVASRPTQAADGLMELPEPSGIAVNSERDRILPRVLYGYSPFVTLKLLVGNQLRMAGLR